MDTIKAERTGIIPLAVAAALVGVAIVTDGGLASATNGAGGILWLAAAVLIFRRLGWGRGSRWMVPLVVAVTFALVLLVRPRDPLMAIVGFSIGGFLIGGLANQDRVRWAAMVPALWLPLHLGVAITRAVLREASGDAASVRTDPPPTAALVPLLMVGSAVGGGLLVSWVLRRNDLPLRVRNWQRDRGSVSNAP